MGWDDLEAPASTPTAGDAYDRTVARVMRVALEDKIFRDWLTRLSMGNTFVAGHADMSAYREGVRSLAVRLLHYGAETNE